MSLLKWVGLACLLFIFGIGNGCTYAKNRGLDFVDIWSTGAGVGLGGSLRGTNYFKGGYAATYTGVRTLGRNVLPVVGITGEAGIVGAPFFHYRTVTLQNNNSQSRLVMLGRTLLEPGDEKNWYRWADPTIWHFLPKRKTFEENFDRRFWDIGASLYLGLGVDFDFNIFEFADFWAGVFGYDICRDDKREASYYAETETSFSSVKDS